MKPTLDIQQSHLKISENWKNLKQGDLSAFEYLYRNYFSELFNYGMTLLPDKSLVKDAIHQVFEDLWKYKAGISEVENPGFYLVKCLRNIIFKHLAESKKHRVVHTSGQENFEVLPSKETLIIDADDEKLREKEVRMLINQLPPRQREVLVLIFFEELTYEEVSSILSISVPSVYTLVWRSIASLRKKYGL